MTPRLLLRVGATTVRAELVRRSKVLWAAEATFATPEELEAAVSQLAAGESLPARPAAIRVELARPPAQLRTLRGLPPVRATQLRALVATQAGRFFRRNGKPLVTDACWPSAKARREGTAVAAAVEEPWLEAVIAGGRAAGIPVESLRPTDLPAGARLDLVPAVERNRRRTAALLSLRRIAIAAGVSWIAAAGAFLVRVQRERAAADREISQLEAPSRAVRDARQALSGAADLVETMEQAQRDRGAVLARLTAVAAALPDSAFVTGFVVNAEGRGEMSVVARRSADVLAALDRTGAAPSPKVSGAVVRETVAGRDWERFSLGFGPRSSR